MQKIKILHIIKSLGRGGAEMLLPETLKLHDKDTFDFHYIYFLPWKFQMVKPIEDAGGKVTCLSANNNIQMLLRHKEVMRYCEEHGIQLIHCHLPWSAFLGRMIFRRTNIPVVYTEHNIQEKMHVATRVLNRLTFNSQTMAIGVSKDATESIKKNIDPKIPVKTVLNGVNTENFKRDPAKGEEIKKYLGIPLNAVVIGNIAVFREQKALLDWVKAFNEVHKNDSSVCGILVGAGPKEDEIRELINDLGLEKKIFLPGLQTDTISYFSAMDIFMMSSAFEGLPIALLEAMSMQCAVVSTKAGGVVEAVRDRKEGLLCEPGDFKTLGRLAQEFVEDEEKRKQFGKASRERVERAFSLKTMVETLEEIYLKLLKNEN